jgi:putative ABC transport system permease protein
MLFYNTTLDGLQMGLCFAVLALGLYISYSVLDFPDLSVDGTFPLGGVVATIMIYRMSVPAPIAVVLSFIAGAASGAVTGILHVKFKISKLLSGIIVMTALLSVTLALTGVLTDNGYTTTIFSYRSKGVKGLFDGELIASFDRGVKEYVVIAILLIFVIAVKLILDLFFKTKLGYMLKATGDNERVVTYLGRDSGLYKIIGLAVANGLSAISGALYAQLYSQYDNTCGSGKVVLALASVIIGTALFGACRRIKGTTASVVGAIIYSLSLNYLVLIDKNGTYLKLLNAVLFALILIFNDKLSLLNKRKKVNNSSQTKEETEIYSGKIREVVTENNE